MAHTNDTYAREIIRAGHDLNITPRGIVIAFATVYVESDWYMWANAKVPESLRLPHERVGNDGYSVGLFQQQVVWGNGAWWWGDAATCMDPYKSARLFFERLKTRDYNHGDPGAHAQAIQRSAYPHRYGQRMTEAQAYYDRLTAGGTAPAPARPPHTELDFWSHKRVGQGMSVRSRPPINFFLHTEEGNGTAESLARYCDGSNGVSYHYTLRDGILAAVVDTDYYSWSVLNANVFSINLCFAGSYASWTREQWLKRERDIEIAAYVAVLDCRKYPTMSTEVIPPPYNGPARPGISDHNYVTKKLGIGTHWDVGPGFPWDVFLRYVQKYDGTGEPDAMTPDQDRLLREVHAALKFEERSRSIYSSPEPNTRGWDVPTLVRNMDGNDHERHVEQEARRGDLHSIGLIIRAAAGKGRFTDEASIARAQRALRTIPTEHLEAWEAAQ